MKISINQRKEIFAYLIMILAVAFAYHKVLFLNHPLKYDWFDAFYPYRYFIGECVQNGILSFWNPYLDAGYQVSADPQGAFYYPFTYIFSFFGRTSISLFQIEFMLHIFLAAFGFYNLSKKIHKHYYVSIILGISYAMSGLFVGNAQHYTYVVSATWLPYLFIAVMNILNKPGYKSAMILALVYYLIISGGYPAFIIISTYIIAFVYLYVLVKNLRANDYQYIKRLLLFTAVASVVAVMLNMGQFISLKIILPYMHRGDGVGLEKALQSPLSPKALVSFILPYGTVRNYYDVYSSDMSMINAYFGLLSLISMVYAFFYRQSKFFYMVLGVSILCLITALGDGFLLRELLYKYVPGMDMFRFPSIFRFFVIIGFLICAGFGMKHIFESCKMNIRAIAITLFLMLGLGIMLIYIDKNFTADLKGFALNDLMTRSENSFIAQHLAFQGIVQFFFLGSLVFGIYFLNKKQKLAISLIVTVCVLELGMATWFNSPYTVHMNEKSIADHKEYEKNFVEGFPIPYGKIIDGKRIPGYGHYWRNLSVFHKKIGPDDYNPFKTEARYFIEKYDPFIDAISDNEFAYFTDSTMLNSMFNGVNTANTHSPEVIFVDSAAFIKIESEAGLVSPSDKATVTQFSPGEFTIETNTTNNVVLNVFQSIHPKWVCEIDWNETEILAANFSNMACVVPAGKHTVRFRYNDLEEKAGFTVTFITLLGVLILLILSKFKLITRRKSKDLIKSTANIFVLKPNYEKRVFGLDLMRALAIIFVVLGHGGWILGKANTDFPWIKLIDGVELFFVLSGFLIGGILIKIFHNTERPGIKTLWNFWIRRWFRTLPNYYLILVLNILFVYFGIIREDISQFNWKFFLFLQNFSGSFYNFFWESWSLSIEEWFYLLFPIVLANIFLVFRRTKVSRMRMYLFSVLIFLLTSFLLRYFHASKFEVDKFWLGVKIYKVVIYRLDGIALGLLAALLKYWYPAFWFKSRNATFILGIILSYIVLYYTWLPNDFSTKVFKILFQSIGCFLLLPKFDSIRSAPRVITRVVTHVSLISYSMYLINLALVSEVIRDNFPPHGPKTAMVMFAVYWIVVVVVSTLLYKYYEKPLTDIRDRFRK